MTEQARHDRDRLALIDDVARAMTAADPRAGFQERVMARLAARPRAVRWWRAAAVAAPATVVLIASAVVVTRHGPSAPPAGPVPLIETAAPRQTPALGPLPISPVSSAPAESAPVPRVSGAAGGTSPRRDDIPNALPALPSPEALTLNGIQPGALAIPQLLVRPIDVPALETSAPDQPGGGQQAASRTR